MAYLVIVPATIAFEIGCAIRSTSGFGGRLLLTDHTGARLVQAAEYDRLIDDNYALWVKMADGVHTVAEGLAVIARRHGAHNVYTIPSAINERAFVSPLDLAHERTSPRKPMILSVGHLLEGKGFNHLIQAFVHVAAVHPEWRLDIYGDGPERPQLQCLVDELGMADRIALRGFEPELVTRYRQYPIVASATAYEARSLVLDEAMASGCLTVFPSTAGGPAETIRDRINGLLTRSSSVNDMRDTLMFAIEQFQFDYEWWSRVQNEAIKSARTAHPRVVDESWRNLLNNLIGG